LLLLQNEWFGVNNPHTSKAWNGAAMRQCAAPAQSADVDCVCTGFFPLNQWEERLLARFSPAIEADEMLVWWV